MKKALLLIAACLVAATSQGQIAVDSAWRSDVKTLLLSNNDISQNTPIINLGSSDRLVLQFDVLRDQPETLRYTIAHCDASWHIDNLQPIEFINGFETGLIDQYDFSFTTLVSYVHYSLTFPSPYTDFIYSGNYLLTVALDDDPDSILLTRRFCVSEQNARVEASITQPYDGIAINQRQQLNVDLLLNPPTVAMQYLTVVAQQNGRLDNVRTLTFSGYNGEKLTYRNRPANIFDGGNTFRFFDLSNLRVPMYNVQRIERYGGETFAMIRPEENRSRKHYLAETTLNGGMKINIWERDNPALEADYTWVNISLPMEQPLLGGSIHVVGEFTQWQLDSLSQMEYNPRFRAYTKRILLKQGYYAYQLLYLDRRDSQAQTATLEGNHWKTPNQYTIYVYMRQPSDRADRLLAVGRTIAHQ